MSIGRCLPTSSEEPTLSEKASNQRGSEPARRTKQALRTSSWVALDAIGIVRLFASSSLSREGCESTATT